MPFEDAALRTQMTQASGMVYSANKKAREAEDEAKRATERKRRHDDTSETEATAKCAKLRTRNVTKILEEAGEEPRPA